MSELKARTIVADLDLCQGHANCVMIAPKYFSIGDDDKVDVLISSVMEGDESGVRSAVDSCPVSALRLEP